MSGKPLRFLGIEIDLSGKKAIDDLADWNKEVRQALGLADDYADGVDEMAREMREYAKKIGLTKEQLRELQETSKKNREIGEFAKKYGLSMNEVQQKTREAKESIGGLSAAMGALAAAGIGAKLLGGAKEMSQLAMKSEDLGVSLKVMLGDAGLAKKTLAEFKEFADISPFEPGPVNESGLAMLQFGIEAKDVMKSMQMVGDVAAGTNKDFKDLSALYGKAFALKKVDNEMLQQVPVLYGAIGKVINKSEKDVFDMASKGQISFKIMEQAFKSLTSEGGRYYKMMEERSKTTSGVLSTFAGNIDSVKIVVGAMINEGLRPLAEAGNLVLGWLLKTPWAMNILKAVILSITPIAAIFFGSVLYKAIKTLNLLSAETLKFGIRMVVAFLPIYAIIAIVLALILVIEDLYNWIKGGDSLIGNWLEKTFGIKPQAVLEKIKIIKDKLGEIFKPLIDAIGPFWSKLSALFASIWGAVKVILGVVWDIIKFVAPAIGFVIQIIGTLLGVILWVVAEILGGWINMVGQIIERVTWLVDKITSIFKSLYNAIKRELGKFFDFLFGNDNTKEIRIYGDLKQTAGIAGYRAGGGDIDAGSSYVVGEDGPEIFTSDRSGFIIPNHAISGGKKTNITVAPVFNISGVSDPEAVASLAMKKIESMIPLIAAELGFGLG